MYIKERIAALRESMKKEGLDAYIIPSNDPHQSEYVANHWKSREWISGFSGSAGIAIVTRDHAGLWTDSRYFLQAEEELASSEFELHKQGIPHAPEHITWLSQNLKPGGVIGCDGMLFSMKQIRYINSKIYGTDIELNTHHDLITKIWKDRPSLPQTEVFEHDLHLAGKSRKEKMDEVREQMKAYGASHYLISTLDDIAWLLNIRGRDVAFNPVSICYFILGQKISYLFIDPQKVPAQMKQKLEHCGIVLKDYNEISNFLKSFNKKDKILIDSSSTSIGLFQLLPQEAVIQGQNYVLLKKAIKNPTEIEHIRKVMVKDGVALIRLFRWLDAELEKRPVTEVEIAEKLIEYRSAQKYYYGESFSAIVGYKGNGAIVHYRPKAGSCAQVKKEGILLLDSGGQYEDGTTDITRTIALGKPNEEQKRNYTLVLKGHIALATIQFPKGTRGMQLDTLARMYLWKDGLNFGHGTGHGVGFFLNVHEAPQGFATNPSTSRGTTSFEAWMFTSNEPGFYKTGEYGIRIENLVLCVEGVKTDSGEFLKFETLTLFPIATNLIDKTLLTKQEKEWLNAYHREVFEKLSPVLETDEKAWLKEQCKAI